MIGMGIVTSHAPGMFCPPEVWPRVYAGAPLYTRESQPHTARLETPEVIESYVKRINQAFARLQTRIEDYRPDAILILCDHESVFKERHHMACVYTDAIAWGPSLPGYMGLPPEASRVEIPVHTDLAKFFLDALANRGFDVLGSENFKHHGNHPQYGTAHGVTFPLPKIVPSLDIPVIPIFLNERDYVPPMPNGQQCWEFGQALAEIAATRSERIVIYGSGGMSHDPDGPRAGWVDEPLDRWIMKRLTSDRSEELQYLFNFDSDTFRGGTGELRAWIVAAGACRRPAIEVEYIPAHHAKTGLGFAFWPPEKA